MKMLKRIIERWKKFLKRIEEVSKEEYGEKSLSCCDVNKDVEYQRRNLKKKIKQV